MKNLFTTVVMVIMSISVISAQSTNKELFPKLSAVQFDSLHNGNEAAISLATYDMVWTGALVSGGKNGYNYPETKGYGDHANKTYHLGSSGYAQEVFFKAKLLNPEMKVLTHRNLTFIECHHFDYGENLPQRWFVDNLSPKWFAYSVLTHLTDSTFSKKTEDTLFHIPIEDAKIMYKFRKPVNPDSIPENWDGYWRKGKTQYYWDYICFKDNDAGAGRGEFEIMAIRNIDTITGTITVTRKIKNGIPRGRTIYGTPQSYTFGDRIGYISYSNAISGSPGIFMNRYANNEDSSYKKEMVADGFDWIRACTEYVEKYMMPTSYTGYNPRSGSDTTINLIDGVKMDADGQVWKPYNFDRDGWPYYGLDLNWDNKIDWVGITSDPLMQSPDWDTLNQWLAQAYKRYTDSIYNKANELKRPFYTSINGHIAEFPTIFNGRNFEDFNKGFQEGYIGAIKQYIELNKPNNTVDPMIADVYERDRDSSKVGLINFKEHKHIMALTTVLGNGAYGHCGDYSTHNKLLNTWKPKLGILNPEDWFDEFSVDSLGRSSKYLYPEGNAKHRFDNRKWLGEALTGAIRLDSIYLDSFRNEAFNDYIYTYIRYFKNGAAIYSQYNHNVKISGNYRRILGVDPENDGSIIEDSIHMEALSGLFLFKIPDTRIAKFRKRPYMIYPGIIEEMKLLWQLDTFANCTLSWGLDTNYFEGEIIIDEYQNDFQYIYDFVDLTPNTKYFYKIEIENGETKTGTFYSVAEFEETKLKFMVFGDSRNNQNAQNRVFGRMSETMVNDENYQTFTISTGDLVSIGYDEASWDNELFNDSFQYIQYILGNLPIQSVMGNHEGKGILYRKYFPNSFKEYSYYAFEYGPAVFIYLDPYLNSAESAKDELIWLDNILKNSTKKWKFIVLHEPGYSASGGHVNSKLVQKYVQPLCVQYGVQIVFGGHNHYYSRAVVDGVTHITTGGGGAPLMEPNPNSEFVVKAQKDYHFCKIEIDDNTLYFAAITDAGNIIEEFLINLNTSGISKTNNFDNNDIYIYPNPAKKLININIENKITGFIKLTDISGRILRSKRIINANNSKIEIDNLKNGLYFLEIIDNTRKIVKKIVINN